MSDPSYRALLDATDDLFLGIDEAGVLREWNRSLVEITDRQEAALSGMAVEDLFPGEEAEHVAAAVGDALETGESSVDAAFLTAERERIHVEFGFDRVADVGEDGIAVVGIGRELTGRRETARERRERLDRMTDGFHVLDTDWTITHINEAGARIISEGLDEDRGPDELVGEVLWELVPEAVGTEFYELYHDAMETQESVSFEEYYPPQGKWFDVRAYPSETGLSVYFHDVTERRERRESLEHREHVLREMYDVIADRERSFTEQVEALLALGRAELGTAYGSLAEIRDEDYVFEVVDAADDRVQAGDVVPVSATNCEITASTEQTLVLGDIARDAPGETDRAGYTDWGISCYIGAPVYGADETYGTDEVYGTFCFYDTEPRADQFGDWEVTIVDLMSRWVSYELQREQAREQLERQNERLDRFASVVSHDLRNPLNVLKMRLELAEQGDTESFDRCYGALDRMETLVEDLLTLARAGDDIGETADVPVADVAERCWERIETASATLRTDIDRTVSADVSRLTQLFENLVRNAIEHGGPDVTITVGSLDDGFYVADDGPGIDAEDRGRVFETGFTTAETGTGMGLSIVEEVAGAHGWTVSVGESATGGARFEFTGTTAADPVEA